MSLSIEPAQDRQCAACGCRSDIRLTDDRGFRPRGVYSMCEPCFMKFAGKVADWVTFIMSRPGRKDP